ncbi:DUF5990 family protein [Hydrocarboniphaga effusa]|uniref:DUF5990 family protein n=2 Tax=Hydrocarboniphaga effusa TaxID=243629 RepID=UPI0035B4F8BA
MTLSRRSNRPTQTPRPVAVQLVRIAQGPASDRFLYLNSGTMAGQTGTEWTLRAKIKTGTISWAWVDAVLAQDNAVLLAEIHGLARDGGPCCGTVPVLGGGWKVLSKPKV